MSFRPFSLKRLSLFRDLGCDEVAYGQALWTDPSFCATIASMKRGRPVKLFIAIGAIVLAGLICAQFFSIYVIQPIGAIPQGRTLIISRLNSLNFIDSADAWCERNMGYVNLLCRSFAMANVVEKSRIVARLPYSQFLYEISTGGKHYTTPGG